MAASVEKGVNSYVSLEEAESYFEARLDSSAWVSAPSEDREKALITAARALDRLTFIGRPADPTQPLAFPRIWPPSVYVRHSRRTDPFYDPEFPPDSLLYRSLETGTPRAVLDAQCEEALALLSQDASDLARQRLQAQGVKSFGLGRLSESYGPAQGGLNTLKSLEARQLLTGLTAGTVTIV